MTDELPTKQKFKSAQELCNDDNYDALPEQPEATFRWSNRQVESMKWNTRKPFVNAPNPKYAGRRPAKDLLSGQGPSPLAKENCDTADSIWSQMITDEDVQKLVDLTNEKLQRLCDIKADILSKTDKKTQFKLTNAAEIKAMFGVLYMCGALRQNLVSIDNVFYHDTANPIFSACFERKRFSLLCQFLQTTQLLVKQDGNLTNLLHFANSLRQ